MSTIPEGKTHKKSGSRHLPSLTGRNNNVRVHTRNRDRVDTMYNKRTVGIDILNEGRKENYCPQPSRSNLKVRHNDDDAPADLVAFQRYCLSIRTRTHDNIFIVYGYIPDFDPR